MNATDSEAAVREILDRIDAAWRHRRFEGLEERMDPAAVIVGRDDAAFARGTTGCAASYRTFASHAAMLQ